MGSTGLEASGDGSNFNGVIAAAVFAGILIAAGMAIKQMDEFLEDVEE